MPTYNVSISLYINVKNTAQITIKAENKEDAKEQARSIHQAKESQPLYCHWCVDWDNMEALELP
jgi:hypothetical protein